MVNRNLTCACCASTLGLNEGHDYLHDAGGVICKDCIFRESDEACACCGGSLAELPLYDATAHLCRAGDACPLSDLLADGNCCASCFREQLARVPGADGLGRHGAVVAKCGHVVCAATAAGIGDDGEENDVLVRPRDVAAAGAYFAARCPDCRRADVRSAQLDLQLKFAAQDEPLMRNLIRQARSETVRATARQWLLGREKYGASLPVCRDEATTPPRKSRRL